MIELVVPGPPQGKQRPRFVRATGRTFTPKETELAEARIERAWESAGQQRLDGPVALGLVVVLERPRAHRCKDGRLSAAGTRSEWPCRRPDLDNAFKLAADALNNRAYTDDSQIVEAHAWRRWAAAGEREHTRIVLRQPA